MNFSWEILRRRLDRKVENSLPPRSLVKLIIEIIEPYKGTIFDPACGSG